MIYGVTIFLNDVNFKLKDAVQNRMHHEAFFTKKDKATEYYLHHLEEWKREKTTVYGNREVRGRAEMYKCRIDDGMIRNGGITIYKETI